MCNRNRNTDKGTTPGAAAQKDITELARAVPNGLTLGELQQIKLALKERIELKQRQFENNAAALTQPLTDVERGHLRRLQAYNRDALGWSERALSYVSRLLEPQA